MNRWFETVSHWKTRAEAAEAQVEQAERTWKQWMDRALTAEAQVARLTDELRERMDEAKEWFDRARNGDGA